MQNANQQEQFNQAFQNFYGNMSQGIPFVSSESEAKMTPADVHKFHAQFFAQSKIRELAELSDSEVCQIHSLASRGKFTAEQLARVHKISPHLVNLIRNRSVRRELLNDPSLIFMRHSHTL